ncbi:MAG: hypothetical protein AUJ98_11565 [Bacteroidetes bacterium CG2_30_33_31]|nr:MAG: hypothetical protein AUJ98_11565 [Bacteroidetes bacterium CG2_30_33_31]
MSKNIENFFSKEQKQKIVEAIEAAEKNTSGEIRVHIESKCKPKAVERAAKVFYSLDMQKTKLRNGVLIYLAIADRKFAIIGDEGINKLVPKDFWNDAKDLMLESFLKENFDDGIASAVAKVGEKLKEYFPYKSDDINELGDEISFGK